MNVCTAFKLRAN